MPVVATMKLEMWKWLAFFSIALIAIFATLEASAQSPTNTGPVMDATIRIYEDINPCNNAADLVRARKCFTITTANCDSINNGD
jgi:hypothetical protein